MTDNGPKMTDPDFSESVVATTKRERTRLAEAELLVIQAMRVQSHADDIAGKTAGIPFYDAYVEIARKYGLAPADIARLMAGIADCLDTMAKQLRAR